MQQHAALLGGIRKRRIHVANLDPAAENFGYQVAFDIRDLISVPEVMEELGLGPNGGLIYCMEYLVNNLDWLQDQLENFDDDEYLMLDCPGQLELYTHVPLMNHVIDRIRMWGYGANMMSVFLLDTTFLADTSKFISGSLLSLSAMIALELPHVNIMTKCDLMSQQDIDRILSIGSASEVWGLEQDAHSLLLQNSTNRDSDQYDMSLASAAAASSANDDTIAEVSEEERQEQVRLENRRRRRQRLTNAICDLLDDYTMVSFLPLNIQDEDSVDHVLSVVDATIQYGEDAEVRGADYNLDADEGDGAGQLNGFG